MSKPRYVLVRVSLLKGALKNRNDTFTKILNYAVKDYAANLRCEPAQAYGIAAYDFLQNKGDLPGILYNCFNNSIGEYNSSELLFNFGEFNPNPAYEMAVNEGLEQSDLDAMITYAKFKKAHELLNLNGCGISRAMQLPNINSKEPLAMVSISKLIEFRDHEKSQHDIIQFCAYIAIKSFLGKRPAVKTNIKGILERALPNEKKVIAEYSTRRKFEALRTALELHWHLKFYSNHTRGFWVSGTLTYEELAVFAEKNKIKNKVASLKKQKHDAKLKAAEVLKNVQFMYG